MVLLVGLAVLALLPNRYLPDGEGINLDGIFEGRPVMVQWPRQSTAPYDLALDLEKGVCKFVQLDAAGRVLDKWSASRITQKGHIRLGGQLQFFPTEGAVGRYRVRVGRFIVWGALLTVLRVAVVTGCLSGMAAVLCGWRGLGGLLLGRSVSWRSLDRRRYRVATAMLAFSGIVLYPAIHEGGHELFGTLFGARPSWGGVRWTCLQGEEPHAAFYSMPPEALPWMGTGGILFPTLIGLVLLLFWRFCGGRMRWWLQMLLVVPGLVLLAGNLGLFADVGHTLPLATHFGLGGVLAQIAARVPALVTLGMFAWIVRPATRLLASPPVSRAAGESQPSEVSNAAVLSKGSQVP